MLLLIKQWSVFPFSFEIELTFANVRLNELNVVEMTAYSQESVRVLPGSLSWGVHSWSPRMMLWGSPGHMERPCGDVLAKCPAKVSADNSITTRPMSEQAFGGVQAWLQAPLEEVEWSRNELFPLCLDWTAALWAKQFLWFLQAIRFGAGGSAAIDNQNTHMLPYLIQPSEPERYVWWTPHCQWVNRHHAEPC